MRAILINSLIFITIACSSADIDYRLHDIWLIEEIGTRKLSEESPKEAPILELYPGESRFNGSTGCNRISGRLGSAGESISFTEIISTRMICPDYDENLILEKLSSVNRYKFEDLRLTLYKDDKVEIILKKID